MRYIAAFLAGIGATVVGFLAFAVWAERGRL